MQYKQRFKTAGIHAMTLLSGMAILLETLPEEASAKVSIIKPNINVTPKGKTPNRNISSSEDADINGSSNDNPHPAIYCDGHDVLITGASASNAFDTTPTKIYIDNNDNQIFEDSECQEINLSLVYVYGGSQVKDKSYTKYSRTQTITMQGGEVAAIYAGGYTNIQAQYSHNVNINVTDGRIGYVSANWDRGPSARSLSWGAESMSGTVTITLTNCEYPYYNYPTILDPYSAEIRQHVKLFDFSNHTYTLTGNPWFSAEPNFKAYVVQTGPGEYRMGGTEEVIIPAGTNLKANKIVVDNGATIRNQGNVVLRTCANGSFQNDGAWTGNPAKMPHEVSKDVIGHDASTHSQRCTLCGQEVASAHIWKYIESATTATSHTHIRVCQICGYSEDGEACTLVCTSVGNEGHSSVCSLCNHQFDVQPHSAKSEFWANLHQKGAPSSNPNDYNDTYDYGCIGEGTHRAVCNDCGVLYSEEHNWVKSHESTDSEHALYCNKCYMPKSGAHNYMDGKCTECDHAHESHSYANGKCDVCGYGCRHTHYEYVSDGADQHLKRCTECGSNIGQGNHDYVADNLGRVTCSLCEYSCQHEHTTALNDQTVCDGCHLPMVAKVNIVSQDYYFADVKTAALYALSTKAKHTITLVEDIELKETLELTLPEATDKLTLDMNGHDISLRQLNVNRLYNAIDVYGKGTLDIINTQFADDGNYAHITTNSVNGTSLKAFNETHVNVEGCYLTAIQLGRNEGIATGFITLVNCQAEKVETYDGSNYNIYGRVEVLSSLQGKNADLSQMLPQGIIITEQQADQSWKMRWNRQSQVIGTLKAGPYWLTHYVALEACTEHQVSCVTQYAHEDYHVGVCDLCGRNDAQQPHSFTRAGRLHSDTEHVVLCEVCDHVSPTMGAHSYNKDGVCTGDLCHATAAVKLTLMNSSDVRFYGDFQSAWAFANQPYAVDTLTLLKDVSITEPLTFNREKDVVDESNPETLGWYYPYIIIKGEGKTISYTGSGSAVTYPDDDDRADPLSLEGGLKLSGTWPAKAAQIGYVINGNEVVEHDCLAAGNAGNVTYTLDKNGDAELSTHTFYCKVCRRREHRSHEYDGTASCLCGVERMIVATVTAAEEPTLQCGSMEEAWLSAINLSKTSDKEVTIQLLKDADVTRTGDPELAYALPLSDSDVSIVFNGTDPQGVEHKLYEVEDRYLFHVSAGHLTILSGKFHGPKSIVSAAQADCVTLRGGTYPKETRDAISASYYYRYGVLTSEQGGVANMIAPGCILTATANNDLGNLRAGEIVNNNSDEMIACASGVITPCQHTHKTDGAGHAATCTTPGNNAGYWYCPDCDTYFDADGNDCDESDYTIAALGHEFDANGQCTRCDFACQLRLSSIGETKEIDNVICHSLEEVIEKIHEHYYYYYEYYGTMRFDSEKPRDGFLITLDTDVLATESFSIGSYHQVTFDLNGHTLDMNGRDINAFGGFTFKNGTAKNVGMIATDWDQDSYKNVDGSLTLENAELNLTSCTLVSLSMDKSSRLSSANVTYIYWKQYYEYDQATDSDIYYYDESCYGIMHALINQGYHPDLNSGRLEINNNGSWSVKYPQGMYHTYKGDITNNGQTHGGKCSVCQATTREEHIYSNNECIICKDKAEASVTCDGITSSYHSLHDAYEASKGKKATITVLKDVEDKLYYYDFNDTANDITLDLNGKTLLLNSGIVVTEGHLTIKDDASGQGTIEVPESGHALYVAGGWENSYYYGTMYHDSYLTVLGGNFIGKGDGYYGLMVNGAISPDEDNQYKYAHVSLQGGTYSSISAHANTASTNDVMCYLAPGCFYVDASQTDFTPISDVKKANSIWDIDVLDNVAVYNSAQKIELTEGIAKDETEQQLVNNATTNLWVNTFIDTQLAEAVDLQDPSIISALQRAAAQQGVAVNVNSNSDINALIQATLKQVNIEDVTVADNTVKVISCMTFDVKPMAQFTTTDGTKIPALISNDQIQGTVVFRLPVDQNLQGDYLAVFHKADDAESATLLGNFPIVTMADGLKYVEVTTDSFSEFSYMVSNYYELIDGTEYSLTESRTNVDLTYTRRYWDNDWNALYVPFGISVSEFNAVDCDIFAINMFHQYDTDNDGTFDKLTLEVIKAPATAVTLPNHPYLLRYNGDVDTANGTVVSMLLSGVTLEAAASQPFNCSSMSFDYTFQGTYSGLANASDVYSLIVDEETGATTLGQATNSLRPQRWFMTMTPRDSQLGNTTSAAPRRIRIVADDETDIDHITDDATLVRDYFTTDGNRRSEAQQGINIVRMLDGSTRKIFIR